MTRQCNRSGCCDSATATLGYDYAQRTAWVVDLIDAPHPATYDLCARHGDGLSVPMGWTLHDQRRMRAVPLFESSQAS